MDTGEMQKLMDGLDRRLALGEIDIGTYNALKAKFTAQASASPKADPVGAAVSAIPKEATALRCPGCTSALKAPSDPSATTVVCEFCGGTFALKAAAAEMDRLREDIHKWITGLVGATHGSGTVDEASRLFIFREKVFPTLRTAANLATELFSFSRYQPIFGFPLLDHIDASPFREAVQSMPELGMVVERVKLTVAQVQAPEVLLFAVGTKEKAQLAYLEVLCEEAIYLSNARRQLSLFTADGMSKAQTNLQAIRTLYKKFAQGSAEDQAAVRFMTGLSHRANAVSDGIKVLQVLLTRAEGFMADKAVAALEKVASRCEEAAAEIEQSGAEPKDAVPVVEGTRTDAQTIRLLGNCVRLFADCGAETGESFSDFMSVLSSVVDQVKGSGADQAWLADFISRLYLHMSALDGKSQVPVYNDFSWVNSAAEAQVKSSIFSGKETAEVQGAALLPFWMAELRFAQQSGLIFKKGQAAEGLLFLSAARQDAEWFALSGQSGLITACRGAVASPKSLGKSRASAAPVVSSEHASLHLRNIISRTPNYAGGSADIQGLVYLPVAIVKYANRKGARQQVITPFPLQMQDVALKTLKMGSRNVCFAK